MTISFPQNPSYPAFREVGNANSGAGNPAVQGTSNAPDAIADDALLRAIASQFGLDPTTLATAPFGETAISLPQVEASLEMQSLSTADLLQLVRAASRQTTELLLAATQEAIQNLKAQIELNSKSSMENLEKAAEKQEKAEKLMKIMKIVQPIIITVAVVASIAAVVVSGGAAGPLAAALISGALMATTMILSSVKDNEGKSVMDNLMGGLGDAMKKLADSYGDTSLGAKIGIMAGTVAVAAALAFASPKTLALTLPVLAMEIVGTLPDKLMSDDMKGQIMASIAMTGAMIAVSVIAVSASTSMVSSEVKAAVTVSEDAASETAKQATTMAKQAAEAAAKTGLDAADESMSAVVQTSKSSMETAAQVSTNVVDDAGSALAQSTESSTQATLQTGTKVADTLDEASVSLGGSKLQQAAARLLRGTEILKNLLEMGDSATGIAVASQQFQADKANATVMALKETMKMLQTLLDGDASFISTLAQIQAQLDAGCAEVVAIEHQTNENINREMFS